jgi:hypothetical protein
MVDEREKRKSGDSHLISLKWRDERGIKQRASFFHLDSLTNESLPINNPQYGFGLNICLFIEIGYHKFQEQNLSNK